MKKILVSLVLIGASTLYIFSRPTAAALSSITQHVPAQTGVTDTNRITVTAVPTSTNNPPPRTTSSNSKQPVKVPAPALVPIAPKGMYKDGNFTGSIVDAFYGLVQVKAVISGGKISDVVFLSYPNDRSTSREINGQAMPFLKQEAIQAQSANVNTVSGATATSEAFQQSLGSALALAKN